MQGLEEWGLQQRMPIPLVGFIHNPPSLTQVYALIFHQNLRLVFITCEKKA
jgi:hypothetical protein